MDILGFRTVCKCYKITYVLVRINIISNEFIPMHKDYKWDYKKRQTKKYWKTIEYGPAEPQTWFADEPYSYVWWTVHQSCILILYHTGLKKLVITRRSTSDIIIRYTVGSMASTSKLTGRSGNSFVT